MARGACHEGAEGRLLAAAAGALPPLRRLERPQGERESADAEEVHHMSTWHDPKDYEGDTCEMCLEMGGKMAIGRCRV